MASYSDFIERLLLNPDLLKKLTPTEQLGWELPAKIRDTSVVRQKERNLLTRQINNCFFIHMLYRCQCKGNATS